MFLVVSLGVSDINPIFELFTLVLQVRTLLFEFSELVKECSLHLFFVTPNFFLDLQLLLILHGTLEVNAWFIFFHAAWHSSIIGRSHAGAASSVVIPECFYASLDLLSPLSVFLILLLPLSILLLVLHFLVPEGMSKLLSVLLSLPFMYFLLLLHFLSELFVLLCTLDSEILLSLILIQLIVVYPNTLSLVFFVISLGDLTDFCLRDWVFLCFQHLLQSLNTWVR